MRNYKIGFTASYIEDHNFKFLKKITANEAVKTLKETLPSIKTSSHICAKDLTINKSNTTDASINGWMNKLFVVFAIKEGKHLAVAKCDDTFSLYTET